MSKIIRMTEAYYDEVRREFEEALMKGKFAGGKVEFSKSFNDTKKKATVYFRESAWMKMQTLIQNFDKEVAWHGTAERLGEPEQAEFVITDILVYPQIITSTTVDTDQEAYQKWLYEQLDDEAFNSLRFQGHSHVNMSTGPSPVDISHQEKIIAQLEDDMFYIFGIFNKRSEFNLRIYDYAANTFYEPSDITLTVLDGDIGLESFLFEAQKIVKEYKYTPPVTVSQASKTGTTNQTPNTSTKIPVTSGSEKNKPEIRKGKRKDKYSKGSEALHAPKNASALPYNSYDYDDNFGYGGIYDYWN